VVEDDADLRAALRFALEDDGLAVESAEDGLTALQKVRRLTPDLVVLDLNMPRMGGQDFLYAWRSGFETPGVPVIVITAESHALRAEDLGVAALFAKPFDVHRLLGCITDLLAVPREARAAAGRDPRGAEMAAVAEDLATALSTLLISVEGLAAAPGLPDDLRALAAGGLDAAQRAAVLARRLHHLVDAPP
jgi:two-component system, chemotaxis family, chemotaxis protein CheY